VSGLWDRLNHDTETVSSDSAPRSPIHMPVRRDFVADPNPSGGDGFGERTRNTCLSSPMRNSFPVSNPQERTLGKLKLER